MRWYVQRNIKKTVALLDRRNATSVAKLDIGLTSDTTLNARTKVNNISEGLTSLESLSEGHNKAVIDRWSAYILVNNIELTFQLVTEANMTVISAATLEKKMEQVGAMVFSQESIYTILAIRFSEQSKLFITPFERFCFHRVLF